MKKTMIALMALVGVAAAETMMVSPSSTNYDKATAYGFNTTLTSTWLNYPDFWEATDIVTLQSVSIKCADSSGNDQNTVKLAIYTYGGSDGSVGELVSLSDNTATATVGGTLTFNFTDTDLCVGDIYTYMFVKETTTAADLIVAEGSTATSKELYQAQSIGERIGFVNNSSIPGGQGMFKNNTAGGAQGWWGTYMPNATFTVTPEPATATLSLLALAGLAARRRRH